MEGGGPLVVAGGSEPDDTDVDSVDEESRAYDDQEGEEEWPRRSLKAASREASVPLAQGVRTDLLCPLTLKRCAFLVVAQIKRTQILAQTSTAAR